MATARSSSESAAAVVLGNDDLLMEILLRLPAKQLIRFQLVSRHWQSLIITRLPSLHTLHHHSRRSKPTPSFILHSIMSMFYYFNPLTRVFVPFNLNLSHPRILQSCHGLMLVEYRNTPFGRKDYCIYNPTTRQSRRLLIENSQNNNNNNNNNNDNRRRETIAGLALAFDPVKSPHYKVVCVKCMENSYNQFRVEIYDSGTRTWTRLAQTISAPIRYSKFSNGIYWNNGIYWIRPRAISYYLDFETGTVGNPPEIRIPTRRLGESNKNFITESNGHMHCVSLCLRPEMKSVVVFELFGDSWLEKFRGDLNPVARAFYEMNSPEIHVLGMIRGETDFESAVLFHVQDKIIFYRFLDGGFGVLFDLQFANFHHEGQFRFDRHHVFPFIETLIPV